MISDPYKVLGVPQDASDEQIKKAYRALAKKYHPDVNPDDKEAERRMNEINAAYDQIKNPQQAPGGTYGGAGTGGWDPFGGFGGFGGYGSSRYSDTSNEPTAFRAAMNYIRTNHFQEALNALSEVPSGERNARWYYLCALAHYGLGNRIAAIENAEMANGMEPGNHEYQTLLNELKTGGSFYRTYSQGFPTARFNGSMFFWCIAVNLLTFFCRFCACGI